MLTDRIEDNLIVNKDSKLGDIQKKQKKIIERLDELLQLFTNGTLVIERNQIRIMSDMNKIMSHVTTTDYSHYGSLF